MRAAPTTMPARLPTKSTVIPLILNAVENPDTRLDGRSLYDLLNQYVPNAVCWLTGSRCWMPAVFCEVYSEALNFTASDFDVVFANSADADDFIEGVLASLPGSYTSKRKEGTATIMGRNTEKVMDVWFLEEDESMAELLMSFPYSYQRCAYLLNGQSSEGNLTRIVSVKSRPVGKAGSPPRVAPAPVCGRSVLDGTCTLPDGHNGLCYDLNVSPPLQTATPVTTYTYSGPVTVTLLCGQRIPYTSETCQLDAGHEGACSPVRAASRSIFQAVRRAIGPY